MNCDSIDPELFGSMSLVNRFWERTRLNQMIKICPDDSVDDSLIKQPDLNFIHELSIIGSLPKTDDKQPKVLFTLPLNTKNADYISLFCFPHECEHSQKTVELPSEVINQILNEPKAEDIEFLSVYFPLIEEAPYFFCCKYVANPFSIPSICHDYNLDNVFSMITKSSIPTCEICIAIQTYYPFQEMYYGFLKWLICCEQIGKYSISPLIDSFLISNEINSSVDKSKWPSCHRRQFSEFLSTIIQTHLDLNSSFVIDRAPYPKFAWDLEPIENMSEKLVINCVGCLLDRIDCEQFIVLLSSLLLQKHVIIFYKKIDILTNIIIAIQNLILPLEWHVGIIPILPDSRDDLIQSPTPVIIGVDHPLSEDLSEDNVFLDLENNRMEIHCSIPNLPFAKLIRESFYKYFDLLGGHSRAIAIKEILDAVHQLVKKILSNVRPSIMTDYSNLEDISSRFFVELFMKRFDKDNRAFIQKMLETQILKFYIEKECKKASQNLLS